MARQFSKLSSDLILSQLSSESAARTYAVRVFCADGNSSSGAPRIFSKGITGTSVAFYAVTDLGVYEFDATFSGVLGQWTIPNPTDNAWHGIVVGYDDSDVANNPSIWSDGTSQTVTRLAAPTGTAIHNGEQMGIGNRPTTNNRGFGGSLAEFAVWDRLLQPSEAVAISQGISPMAFSQNLVEYIPLFREVISYKLLVPTVTGTTVSKHPRTQLNLKTPQMTRKTIIDYQLGNIARPQFLMG